MPLPPALAAKLAKRGLNIPTKPTGREIKSAAKSSLSCPNKYNIYHECNSWCQFTWKPTKTPEARYLKNMRKLIERYPIPINCSELFDIGVGRYYYWDMEKNMVSWLPPTHPKASQTEPASKLRLKSNRCEVDPHESRDSDKRKDRHSDHRDNDDDDRKHSKYDDRDRGRRRNRKENVALDPMDPASYSDVPRGGWGDGLETTKADPTATGTLFQQRPYPAPGDILEANKKRDKK